MNKAAVFSTWVVGALFSVVGIVFDAVASTRAIVREKSSSHYAESCYIRFICRALSLANYGIQIWYCTPFIFVMNYPIMFISACGVIAEFVVITVIIYFLQSRRHMITMISILAATVTFVVTVVLVAICHIPTTDDTRGEVVGTVAIVTSFLSLVGAIFDMRVIWEIDAIAELSVYGTVLGLLGTGSLCAYGILFSHVFIAARHGCAAGMYATILLVIYVHHCLRRLDILDRGQVWTDARSEPSLQYLAHIVDQDTRAMTLAMSRLAESHARLEEGMARMEASYSIVVEDIASSTSTDVPPTYPDVQPSTSTRRPRVIATYGEIEEIEE